MYRLIPIALLVMLSSSSTFSQGNPEEKRKTTLAKQNNPNHAANNFSYTTDDGKMKQLYALDAKYILLYFYNPECDACKQYRELLAKSKTLNNCVKKGTLKVLAVYIDRNLAIWKKHLPEMPKNWIQGRDTNEYLFRNNIYDLHAIPTIYLLDKDKKVMLKDVLSIATIEKEVMK